MRIGSYWMAVLAATGFLAVDAHATENALKGGNAGLVINNSGRIDMVPSTIVNYANRTVAQGRRAVELRLAQPVLCADFANPPNGGSNPVGLVLTDPNNETGAPIYGGITAYDYLTNGASNAQLKVSAGSNLACCIMLPASNASCLQGVNGGAVVEILHASGFENPVSEMAAGANKGALVDLQVVVTGPSTAAPGSLYNYSVTVTNLSSTAVSNVKVRDWFPKSTGGFIASFAAGNWNCSLSTGGNCGSGSGNLNVDGLTLNGLTSATYSIARTLASGILNGASFSLSAAAFSPPSANESSLGNNQGAASGVVQNSLPPTISDIANQPQFGLFLEDTALGTIAFTASDADSVLTTASFSCQSTNSALFDNRNCEFGGSEPNFTLTLTPSTNANGTATVTVNVSDGVTQVSDSFTATVNPVNDAPSFTLGGNITRPLGTLTIQQVNNFVSSIATGPANENGQTFLERTVSVLPGSASIFAISGEPTISYSGTGLNELGNLAFLLNGLPGSATIKVHMQDNWGVANGGDDDQDQFFTISVP